MPARFPSLPDESLPRDDSADRQFHRGGASTLETQPVLADLPISDHPANVGARTPTEVDVIGVGNHVAGEASTNDVLPAADLRSHPLAPAPSLAEIHCLRWEQTPALALQLETVAPVSRRPADLSLRDPPDERESMREQPPYTANPGHAIADITLHRWARFVAKF